MKFRVVVTTVTGRLYESGSFPHEEHQITMDELDQAISDDGAWMTLFDSEGGSRHTVNVEYVESVTMVRHSD